MTRIWFVVCLILVGSSLLLTRQWLVVNLGWVDLTKQIYGTDPLAAKRAEAHFSTLQKQGVIDSRAVTGHFLHTLLNSPPRTQLPATINGDALDLPRVMAVGEWLYNQGNYSQAMKLFAAAHQLAPGTHRDAWLSIGLICQQLFYPFQADVRNVELAFDCDEYWAAVADNLMINGDFSSAHLRPWFRRYQTDIVYRGETIGAGDETASQETTRQTVASITSSNGTSYGGLYQTIHLPPGTPIRFSARIKVETAGPMLLYPLYIRGETEDGRWRRSLRAIRESTEWMTLEHEYTIPPDHHLPTAFYPVYFQGIGTIWLDDVRLEVLE